MGLFTAIFTQKSTGAHQVVGQKEDPKLADAAEMLKLKTGQRPSAMSSDSQGIHLAAVNSQGAVDLIEKQYLNEAFEGALPFLSGKDSAPKIE